MSQSCKPCSRSSFIWPDPVWQQPFPKWTRPAFCVHQAFSSFHGNLNMWIFSFENGLKHHLPYFLCLSGWVDEGINETKLANRASLVAQWLRICLPMQGTQVRSLVQEDPTCCGATKSVSHNYWARVPQLLKPVRLEPVLRNKRSHHNEKPTHHNEE